MKSLNFSLPKGSKFVLMGPSGAGKSTFFRLLAGLLSPTNGSAEIFVKKMGMVFQKNALFDSMTAIDNILFPIRIQGEMLESQALIKARSLLESLGLAQAEHLFPAELSGGMQKRLALARALALDPELLLCDDPTAGLDPITGRALIDFLLMLHREKAVTILMVTNDVARALQMTDQLKGQLGFLSNGNLVTENVLEVVKNHLQAAKRPADA